MDIFQMLGGQSEETNARMYKSINAVAAVGINGDMDKDDFFIETKSEAKGLIERKIELADEALRQLYESDKARGVSNREFLNALNAVTRYMTAQGFSDREVRAFLLETSNQFVYMLYWGIARARAMTAMSAMRNIMLFSGYRVDDLYSDAKPKFDERVTMMVEVPQYDDFMSEEGRALNRFFGTNAKTSLNQAMEIFPAVGGVQIPRLPKILAKSYMEISNFNEKIEFLDALYKSFKDNQLMIMVLDMSARDKAEMTAILESILPMLKVEDGNYFGARLQTETEKDKTLLYNAIYEQYRKGKLELDIPNPEFYRLEDREKIVDGIAYLLRSRKILVCKGYSNGMFFIVRN